MRDIELVLDQYEKRVEKEIQNILARGVSRQTQELLLYQIQTGGKRLRPRLAVLSCLACGGNAKRVIPAAAGLEILHTYSLIIDDIIDHSSRRRGQLTTWKKFGTSFAECAGVAYASSVFRAAQQSSQPALIGDIFAEVLKEIVDGEILDILYEQSGRRDEPYAREHRKFEVSQSQYLKMADKKTASLFEAACKVGAISAAAPRKDITALSAYGRNIGIAFQIIDDILDIYGTKKFGKPRGQDIRERKLGNILILFALREMDHSNRKLVMKVLRQEKVTNKDVLRVIKCIQSTNARDKSKRIARGYAEKAVRHIKRLSPSSAQNALETLATSMLERNI